MSLIFSRHYLDNFVFTVPIYVLCTFYLLYVEKSDNILIRNKVDAWWNCYWAIHKLRQTHKGEGDLWKLDIFLTRGGGLISDVKRKLYLQPIKPIFYKKTTMLVIVFQKYGKFWSILLGHFIKHKAITSEEWISRKVVTSCKIPKRNLLPT